jgi:competence protein ComEC
MISFGTARFESADKISRLENFYEESITVHGEITGEPSVGSFSTRYKVKINHLEFEKDKFFVDENIIISARKFPKYETGDQLAVRGKLQKPENFENENGIVFDYINFLRKDNVRGLMYYTGITLISEEKFNVARILFRIKNTFLQKISTVIPSPESELMGGLLLGVKQSLGDELEKEFRTAGLIHVVVLSGYNITIIIVAVFRFLIFLPRFVRYALGVIFVVSFAIMVGSGATVVRASLMAILVIFGKLTSRNYNINKSLFFAGLIMIISNPLIIFYDPSFQLSFVASLGLVNLSPFISRMLKFIPTKFEAREIVSASISTQIAVLPLILNMTGELSVIALPANLIVLPLIPLTMLIGFLTGIAVIIYWPIGLLLGFFAYLLLHFQLVIVRFFANLPFALVNITPPGMLETLLFYGLVVIIFYYRPIKIFEKVVDVLSFSTRLIVRHK